MRLARHLEAVVAELRRCAPALLKAHVRALEGMAKAAVVSAGSVTREGKAHE